ncbi:hypothetical protein EVAR_39638_1 [Eumeta japonica]|uniref:Uncharacterized protein n=1 Tax=Eumeta variegata TaxID=151549 RepID=A0A4C1WGU0_EUMVA|nr:hypothetical protein EVAR_39638_1 [Eumeta japonica]
MQDDTTFTVIIMEFVNNLRQMNGFVPINIHTILQSNRSHVSSFIQKKEAIIRLEALHSHATLFQKLIVRPMHTYIQEREVTTKQSLNLRFTIVKQIQGVSLFEKLRGVSLTLRDSRIQSTWRPRLVACIQPS